MGENERKPEGPAVETPSRSPIEKTPDRQGAGKPGLPVKDLVTITLSVLAFVISAASAYFNILRTEEAVSVTIFRVPYAVKASDDTLYVAPTEEGELIFINSGNRPVVISVVDLTYLQPKERDEPSCPEDAGMNLRTDFEPTVLKPNDVFVRKIRIAESRPLHVSGINAVRRADGAFSFPVSHDNSGKDDILLDICLHVILMTPSTAGKASVFPVFRYHALLDRWMWSFDDEGPLAGKPVVLVHNIGTIFGR